MYNYFNFNEKLYITKQDDLQLARSKLQLNDVLLTITGVSYGKSTIVPQELVGANINQHIVRIKIKNYNPYFISTFLNSQFGKLQSDMFIIGISRPALDYSSIKNITIPIVSDKFQFLIEILVIKSNSIKQQAENLYQEAENLLLEELDLVNFNTNEDNIAIKKFSESFSATGRLDAEYYQPKYDQIINKIKKLSYTRLHDIVKINKSIEPGSEAYKDNGIPFIRVQDISYEEISSPNIFLEYSSEKYTNLLTKKDTILLTKDGTIGIAYCIKTETNLITSSALLHLKLLNSNLLPEYLTLVLNSIIVKLQAERDNAGSIINHWRIEEIKNILIPIVDFDIQQQIESKVQKSFTLRKQAKQLLEYATKVVELAIENSEELAIAWLQQKLTELGVGQIDDITS